MGFVEKPVNMEDISVGIIGMGDMGKMYARGIGAAGWRYEESLSHQE